MTDLSTSNLKRLLDEATPGPWKFDEKQEWEHVAGPEYPPMLVCNEHVVEDCDGKQLFGNPNYTLEDHPGNLQLAAAAPDLAQDALRMREALRDLSEVWEAVSIDPNRTPAEQQLAAAVVDHIDQILGDQDG